MGINKVNYGNTTLIDISNDTVTAGSMLSGTTAHDNSGAAITGTISSKSSSDLTASGATVTAPAGYYASSASKSVASGTAGTPTATKGTVSNHSVSVTPSVTNTTGYITGSTKTGTAVTVSASELVSGSETKTSNGTYDVTNLASLVVNVASSGVHIGTISFTGAAGSQNTITGLAGEPKAFFIRMTSTFTRSSSNYDYYITDLVYNGSTTKNGYWRASNGAVYSSGTYCTWTYSNGTLTITTAANGGGFKYNSSYELTYIY